MQNALNIVQIWCEEKGLRANPAKTTAVLFTRKTKIENLRLPSLFGVQLLESKTMKYLGIILDNKLSWKTHLDTKLEKTTKAFWQCRRAFGRNWGLAPSVIHWFYTTIIRPMLSYGSIVWWKRTCIQTVKDSLTKFQRMICMAMSGSMRTTPTAAMEVILSILPLDIFIEKTAMSTAYRLHCTKQWIQTGASVGHTSLLDQMLAKEPNLSMPTDKMVDLLNFDKKFKVIIPSREDWID